jgi:hypothetical protein
LLSLQSTPSTEWPAEAWVQVLVQGQVQVDKLKV